MTDQLDTVRSLSAKIAHIDDAIHAIKMADAIVDYDEQECLEDNAHLKGCAIILDVLRERLAGVLSRRDCYDH